MGRDPGEGFSISNLNHSKPNESFDKEKDWLIDGGHSYTA
jgi:hypothetical protein